MHAVLSQRSQPRQRERLHALVNKLYYEKAQTKQIGQSQANIISLLLIILMLFILKFSLSDKDNKSRFDY